MEKLEVKQALFTELESVVSEETILASNTSSISITAIFGGLKHPRARLRDALFHPGPQGTAS